MKPLGLLYCCKLRKNGIRGLLIGPPRGKRDGVIGHISVRENGNWMKKIAILGDRSV